MTVQRTLKQNQQLYALLNRAKISDEQKHELVFSHTNGRTYKSAQMSAQECQSLINYLNAMFGIKDNRKEVKIVQEYDRRERMFRKIFSICHELNWHTPEGKLDYARINAWCVKYSELHKPLKEYGYSELPKLITQFENVLKSFYVKK